MQIGKNNFRGDNNTVNENNTNKSINIPQTLITVLIFIIIMLLLYCKGIISIDTLIEKLTHLIS